MMTFPARRDATVHPRLYYSRPSGAATFVSADPAAAALDMGGPALSDPNTGAMTAGSYLPQLPPAVGSLAANVFLVIGLLIVTLWLESGRKVVL